MWSIDKMASVTKVPKNKCVKKTAAQWNGSYIEQFYIGYLVH